MVPFAIAGVQMPIPALQDNTPAAAVGGVVARFPWVQMVVLSELACSGPVPSNPVTLPGPQESAIKEAARRHGVWLIPGSIYERGADGRIYNTCPGHRPCGRGRRPLPENVSIPTTSAGSPSSKAAACGASPFCPAVRVNRTGHPKPRTAICILVLRPPRERLIA